MSLPDLDEGISAARARRADERQQQFFGKTSFQGDSGEGLPHARFPGRGGSWSMAGNGGKMAELGRKSSRETAKGKTSSKNTGKRASRGKKARKAGAERLRLAVDKRLGQNSESLANMLTDQAMGGNVATTRAMVEIAEHKKPQPEPVKKKRGRSLAERLAAEPEWQDDRKEGSAETGGGGAEAAA